MYCQSCGNQLRSNDNFCTVCGKPVTKIEHAVDKNREFSDNLSPQRQVVIETKTVKKKSIIVPIFGIVLLAVVSVVIILFVMNKSKESPAEDFTFEILDGEIKITKYIGTDMSVRVPRMIENRPVTIIGKEAFMNYDMKELVLPNTITTIEVDAFRSCKLLKEITIPDGTTKVYSAFGSCESLETIHLPDTIEYFGGTLAYTQWYKNQPEGVLYIDNVCVGFKGENYPDSITIKDGTKSIVGLIMAFNDKTGYFSDSAMNFTDIYIPESVVNIQHQSVGYCKIRVFQYGFLESVTVYKSFTIHGKSGSCAEQYASERSINFVSE